MNSKGMTLIEIIVVLVLLAIMGLFTFQFVGMGVETYIMAANQAGILAEAKLAMERTAKEIRDANNILAPASGSSGNSINFIKSHSTAVDSDTDITFQKSGSTLERKRGTNPPERLAENVSSFTVTNDSNEIKLELTLSLAGGENVTLHTKVYPKNLPSQFDGDWKEVVQ
jgi:prepilin-type N-terminal cleavage/methylation domain-containing protein